MTMTNMHPAFAAVTERDMQIVQEDIPEIGLIESDEIRQKVTLVFASFLKESNFERISEAPGLVKDEPGATLSPGPPKYDLAHHTSHVVQNALATARTLKEFWGIDYRHDVLLAAAILHDASKLVEFEDRTGRKSELGKIFVHAQVGGVRCRDAGLPNDVAQIVTFHNFTPPHTHVTPRSLEYILVTYADHAAADPISFVEGKPTHFDIKKRFFTVD
ncbi:MAG: HD domain-containing protein [Betaproteobacteria bacterium]|nr:HD domain-containing protein [Betaproteobacteria bacterium]